MVLLLSMVVGAALVRLLPHPPNFAPVAALALFAGAHFESKRLALLVPLVAMLLSDLALQLIAGSGFHAGMPVVYTTFAVIVGIGMWLRTRRQAGLIFAAAMTSSVLFFITTNFAVWLVDGLYAKTVEGLVACYVAAIPFFGTTVAGDLFYTAVMFGIFAAAERRYRVLAPQPGL
jgi:hypothetical protein